ncbi:hypothetical protein B0T20DRAFT_363073 [Sordaria brevicollis]|uniref:Uncharacterized protein n=1 Tax=Sordaria brevicollis TaxID=83679 RepID=A0AAE0P0Z9_SORBR|nr:hypothetical protein B0T20DRAFT_363073 [Sordaria brevicollis]
MASPYYYKDRKDDLRDLKFLNAESPHHINHQHQPPRIQQQQRRSQFWRKIITGGSLVAASTLLLLTTLPADQSQTHRHDYSYSAAAEFLIPPLTFSPGDSTSHSKTFQISIFQDLNFTHNAPGKQDDPSSTTVRIMKNILNSEPQKTDLVILNGLTPPSEKENDITAYLGQIVEPMVRRKLTWASTYGSCGENSSSPSSTKETLFEREKLWLSSRTKTMVEGDGVGVTNYYLPVYAAGCGTGEWKRKRGQEKEERKKWYQRVWNMVINRNQDMQMASDTECDIPALILWFFDSSSSSSSSSSSTAKGKVHPSVLKWFKTTSASIASQAGGRTIPSMGFVSRIPTNNSYDGKEEGDVLFMQALSSTPGFIALFSASEGHAEDDGCYKWDENRISSGQGRSAPKYQGQQGQVVMATADGNEGEVEEGHRRGLNLCFGQHAGSRGARQIIIDQEELKDFEIRTHIRLESGEVIWAATLNATSV